MKFKHCLVTRYNLKLKGWEKTKNDLDTSSDEYFKYRFNVFKRYCLPSVINQTNNNFTWLIYLDKNTKKYQVNLLNDLCKDYDFIKFIFVDGNQEMVKDVNKFKTTDLDYFITTRFDNDDIIHKNFIGRIQDIFLKSLKKKSLIIDLQKGLQMDSTSKLLYHYNIKSNHFLSYVSDLTDEKTVLSKQHGHWIRHTNIITDSTDYLWIELIHKHNKLNKLQNKLVNVQIDKPDFNLL